VKFLQAAFFHHDPEYDDAFVDEVDEEAKEVWDSNFIVKEGQNILLEQQFIN